MTISFYFIAPSAPCRAVLLTARAAGIAGKLKPIVVDIYKGDQLKPEFLKINPEHTVPTIVDHETGLTLWESRAISSYLVDQYAPGHAIYPTDTLVRAKIHKWLYYDSSLITFCRPIHRPLIFGGERASPEALQALDSRLQLFDELLAHSGTKYTAADHLTIADLALASTLDMPVVFAGINVSRWKLLSAWYERVKENADGYEEISGSVLRDFKDFLAKRSSP